MIKVFPVRIFEMMIVIKW